MAGVGAVIARAAEAPPAPAVPAAVAVPDTFPTQSPELAREMVGVSHGNVARVKELLKLHPTLSNANWDWGFGDWESALGAASHVGNREIAELLLASGARPTIFSATMLGQLAVVKAFVEASPGIQGTAGPHSITLLAHARNGGEKACSPRWTRLRGDIPLREKRRAPLSIVISIRSASRVPNAYVPL